MLRNPDLPMRPRLGLTGAIVLLVLAFAALRLATLMGALADADLGLHVDEAQYWDWSTRLAWGYYSKPPVIAVLLAGATALLGDGVAAIKSVGLLLYPLTGLVLGLLAARLARGRGTAAARSTGLLATALFLASPLAALLGLAATTDAPLLLCWSLATALLWRARQSAVEGPSGRWTWLALGLVCGIGLLSKYTFAAWIVGALGWLAMERLSSKDSVSANAHSALLQGLLAAAGVCLALLLPHLAWNAAMGWPTLHHTAEITTVARDDSVIVALGRSLSVPLGVLLMAGPLVLLACGPALAGLRRADPAVRMLAVLHLPLLAVGMAQALRGEPQVNWVAPLVPGLVLLLALGLAGRLSRPRAAVLIALLALQIALGAAVPLAAPLSRAWASAFDGHADAPALPRRLDIWARMRGWPQALATLQPVVAAELARTPKAVVVTSSRSVIAIGSHAWRDLPVRWRAYAAEGPPHSHYELTARWPTAADAAAPVLLLSEAATRAELPADLLAGLEPPELLARADASAGGHSTVTLTLWRSQRRGAAIRPEHHHELVSTTP